MRVHQLILAGVFCVCFPSRLCLDVGRWPNSSPLFFSAPFGILFSPRRYRQKGSCDWVGISPPDSFENKTKHLCLAKMCTTLYTCVVWMAVPPPLIVLFFRPSLSSLFFQPSIFDFRRIYEKRIKKIIATSFLIGNVYSRTHSAVRSAAVWRIRNFLTV